MIAQLIGKYIESDGATLLIDVAGVGYEVEASAKVVQSLPAAGEALRVFTHFVVREDAQLLYGFADKRERELFRAFIKISGVGPKLAMALISSLDPGTLAVAVRQNDIGLLSKVPGVGKKTAERLLVELKNRLDSLQELQTAPVSAISVNGIETSAVNEAEDALVALGYRAADAKTAITAVLQETDGPLDAAALVRSALQRFDRAAS